MIKKGILLLVVSLNLYALSDKNIDEIQSNKNSSLQVYGAGEKIDDKSYKGVGVKYQNNFSEATIEYGKDYEKVSGVYKIDINNEIYTKFGLGYLERELLISSTEKDVDQKTGGVAIGYGDNKFYNLEVGHIISKLDGANDADGYSRISYIEALGKYDLGDIGSIDTTGVYKNNRVYSKNHSDYSLEIGYYPIKDVKLSSKYDSVQRDEDDYRLKAGIEYIFATNEFKPYFSASRQSSKNLSFSITYENSIVNKALNMRDEFENVVNTSDFVAQKVAPTQFNSKSTPQDPIDSLNEATDITDPTFVFNGLNYTRTYNFNEPVTIIATTAGTLATAPLAATAGGTLKQNHSFSFTASNNIGYQTATITVRDVAGNIKTITLTIRIFPQPT